MKHAAKLASCNLAALSVVALISVGAVPAEESVETPVLQGGADSSYPYLFGETERSLPVQGGAGAVLVYMSVADPADSSRFMAESPLEVSSAAPWLRIEPPKLDEGRAVIELRYSADANPLIDSRTAVVAINGVGSGSSLGAPRLRVTQLGQGDAKAHEIKRALLREPNAAASRKYSARRVFAEAGAPATNPAFEEGPVERGTSIGSVVSAASFSGPVSPGQLITIFGSDLANGLMDGASLPLPREFRGTRVEIGGVACPLLFVRRDQINAQLPTEVSPGDQTVRIFSPFGSASSRVRVVAASPELFRSSGNRAIFQRGNGALLSASNPARKGETVTFYGTGIGPTTPSVPTGSAAQGGSRLSRAALSAEVFIGGVRADSSFVGLTPGLVALMQINVTVPVSISGGDTSVELRIGGARSQQTFISVETSGGGGGGNGGGGGGGTVFPRIRVGQTVNGALQVSDRRMMIEGLTDRFADHYRLELSSDQTVTITHRSTRFDAWLNLYLRSGNEDVVVAFDDDSGGGLDSRISTTLPAGVYTIEATSLRPNETGAYTLSVGGDAPPPPASAPVIDSFQADSTSVSTGQGTTLRWSVRNAADVSLNQGIGSVPAAGSVFVQPNSTTTYTLTARGGGATRTASATVAVSTPPPANDTTIEVTNRLGYRVNLTVNGSVVGSVPAGQTASRNLGALRVLDLSYELVRPTLSGRPLGDPISGFFQPVQNPSGTVRFRIDNRFGNSNTAYFQPLISNDTNVPLLMEVNGGLSSQNRCNCTAPAFQQNTHFGYYRMFSNSNVRAYRSGSGYTGRYIFWGADPSRVATPISNLAEPETGRVRLRATSAP